MSAVLSAPTNERLDFESQKQKLVQPFAPNCDTASKRHILDQTEPVSIAGGRLGKVRRQTADKIPIFLGNSHRDMKFASRKCVHPNTGTTTDMSISLTLSSSENATARKFLLPYGTPTKRPKYTYPGLFLGETGGCRRSYPSVEL